MHLMWFRTDLRTLDNTALCAAASRGPVLALFLLSPQQWLAHDDAPCKVDFWLRNLKALSTKLATLNIPLLVREAKTWGAAPQIISELCRTHGISSVHVNREYGLNETQRDQRVQATLEKSGVSFHSYLDRLLFPPGSVLSKSGSYFQIYSQFRKVCYQRLSVSLPERLPPPARQQTLGIQSDYLPLEVDGFATPAQSLRDLWPAGEDAAQQRLEHFAHVQLENYQQHRDFPAREGTSRLGAYLAAGVLSPRQCLHKALANNQGEFETGNSGVVTWINELLWREFYSHILAGYPRVSRHRAFRQETEALPWRQAAKELQAWQQGQTGFPLIDAAMRQLLHSGWMHNRLRMVVAMFLSKNLLIDWREGERWFMRHLIDGDLAANNGGWQWSASTGTDAVPYFRLFNPFAQSEKFDPDGHFIRHWLPELAHLDKKTIHNPAKLGLFGVADYPQPIVDLNQSRERALAAFKSLPHAREISV